MPNGADPVRSMNIPIKKTLNTGIPDGLHRDQKKTVFIMVADKSSVEPGIDNGEERKIIVNKAKSVGNIWRAILSSCCQNDGDLFLSGNELGRKREDIFKIISLVF